MRQVEARALFPFLSGGRIYMNHAATSPLSVRVIEGMRLHLEARSVGSVDTYRTDAAMVDRLKGKVARMINAEAGDRIAFTLNTSDPLSIVATGIDWKSGDRILLNDAEFPANVYPYLGARTRGVEIDFLPARNGVVTPEMVEQHLTPRTRVVALSAVQFLSGYKADLVEIGALCRRHGVLFVIDAIQAVGATPVDVQGMCIDAIGAGAQKWQMSPHGTGFLYVTEELQQRLSQQYLGWLGVKEPWDFFNYAQPPHPTAKRYEGGTMNFPGLWGMDAAVTTLLEFGIEPLSRHLLALTDRFIERIDILERFEVMTPREHERRAGIITFRPKPGVDTAAVFQGLESRSINISLREGALRISPHFYNTMDEVETVSDAIAELVR